MKYHIITFGCQMNKSDSEKIASVLERIGYKLTSKESEANLIVVNMCSVRQSAVDRIFGINQKFSKLKIKNKKLKIILTGCILKEDKKKFQNRFDFILNIKDLPKWPKILKKNKNSIIQPWQINKYDYWKIKPKYENNFRAYVPISIGCNNFCSYCVVPYTRGPEVSRPAKEILSEVKDLIKKGFKEIWLLGENVNSYHSFLPQKQYCRPVYSTKNWVNFSWLLKEINSIPGNFWIRFTSSHPKDFSDELINTIAECEKVTKYINLPVQSGDNEILKKMNRPYTVEHYRNLVKKIREKIPEVCLSTDVIVGFPGEKKKHFENTVKLFKEIKFDMAYIAQYSSRPGTAASKLIDDVSQKEKERRWKILTKILEQTALENNKNYIGKVVDVLVEERKNQFLIGKSWHYKTVKFESDENLIGQFVKVKVINALPWGLKGELIS